MARAIDRRTIQGDAQERPERAFSGKDWDNHAAGSYQCVCCGIPLFDAETKFDSGTGWPSFYAPIDPENVRSVDDTSWFMRRTEVVCAAATRTLATFSTTGLTRRACATA